MAAYESRSFNRLADDIDHARMGVVSLIQDKAIVGWLGASGQAFRDPCEPCPDDMSTLAEAYRSAADALHSWSDKLQTFQEAADSAYWSAWHALSALNVADRHGCPRDRPARWRGLPNSCEDLPQSLGNRRCLSGLRHYPADDRPHCRAQLRRAIRRSEREPGRPLNGIPAANRDQANRMLLDQTIAVLTAAGNNPKLLKTLNALQRKLNEGGQPLINAQDSNAPMNGPDDTVLSSPQVYLLGFSPDGNSRAVIAVGNPDMSDNVVAYAPGMGTYLSDHFVSKDVLHAQNIAVAAGQTDPSHTTSAIIWLGYDAPQVTGDAATWRHELDITGTSDADAGAPAYQHFLAGLRATNTSGDLNLTALGHSYGSLLVGKASQLPGGLGADNVVILGSPGVGFDHASQFGIAPDHVYTAAAAHDPVPQLNYGTSAAELAIPIVGAYWSMLDDHKGGGWFGEHPTDASFGAKVFTVPAGGTGSLGMQAHGQYFDWSDDPRRQSSLQKIAEIVTRRP